MPHFIISFEIKLDTDAFPFLKPFTVLIISYSLSDIMYSLSIVFVVCFYGKPFYYLLCIISDILYRI